MSVQRETKETPIRALDSRSPAQQMPAGPSPYMSGGQWPRALLQQAGSGPPSNLWAVKGQC